MTHRAEILAPAGGYEQLVAAVRCSADAVYLGSGTFNARRKAENFDANTLQEAVRYCHAGGVKVYVALNILITDSELKELDSDIIRLAQAGVDALIIQDLAVARRARELVPSMRLHASTQMTVHNAEGVRELKKLGFCRVVLARELSLEEIRSIAGETDIELEAFVHGAHCMSVSGQCYLSCVLGGRSGNRGRCAQPCRLDFMSGKKEYALSLKDMSYLDSLTKLEDAGVCSFKIEGRMKRPEYVAAAVTACKKALGGEAYDREVLRSVFSRSGFTDGYLTGHRDTSMFGIRSASEAEESATVLKPLAALYEKEVPRVGVRLDFSAHVGEPSVLSGSSGGVNATVEGDVPEKCVTGKPFTVEDACRFLGKTGGTLFFADAINAQVDEGIRLTSSQVNSMRRAVLGELEKKLATRDAYKITVKDYSVTPRVNSRETEFRASVLNLAQLRAVQKIGFKYYCVPLDLLVSAQELIHGFEENIIAVIPLLVFPGTRERVISQLKTVKNLGVTHVLADNLGAVGMAVELGFTVHGGTGLNITNTLSLEEYEKLGLSDTLISFELSFAAMKNLGGTIERGFIGYGRLPLMRLRACPLKFANPCSECRGKGVLTDRKNIDFPVICSGKGYSTLYNSVPLYVGDKVMPQLDFSVLSFTTEEPDEMYGITDDFKHKKQPSFARTNGLYYKQID